MDIIIFENKTALAVAFCEELIRLLIDKKKFYMALSGGSTPQIVYHLLAEQYRNKVDWNKIHFFWGDERCVPPDDEQSNFGMTKKILLNHIHISESNIHPIDGNNIPEKETKRYSEEISKFVKFKNELPGFNLIMLGIGRDGHTASIFPDQMNLIDSEKICETAVHPQSGQKRITLTGTVINNADNVIFLVTGKDKAEILKELVEKRSESENKYPAAKIKPAGGNLKYFADREAAALL
ncbi:MAG: 6-phosphogluconolactonase [Ignavibacteriaceae bacterium]